MNREIRYLTTPTLVFPLRVSERGFCACKKVCVPALVPFSQGMEA